MPYRDTEASKLDTAASPLWMGAALGGAVIVVCWMVLSTVDYLNQQNATEAALFWEGARSECRAHGGIWHEFPRARSGGFTGECWDAEAQ